jgi:hypothetical protein
MQVFQLIGSTMGLAFVAGINLYATVLSIGLGIRFGFIHLPQDLAALSILAHPYILIAAGIIYVAEFFADKIPWVDSLWDSVHTFIRPLGAALLGVTAIGNLNPAIEVAMFLLCGGVALSSHSTKAGARLAANHSPEPFSNIGLSFTEDLIAVGGTWLALTHPLLMLGIVLIFLIIFAFVAPSIFRLLRVETMALLAILRMRFGSRGIPETILFDKISDNYAEYLPKGIASKETGFCIRCTSGRGIDAGRNYLGFMCLGDDCLFFITRKHFRIRRFDIDMSKVDEVKFERKLLLDRLIFCRGKKKMYLYLFKNWQNRGKKIVEILEMLRQKKAKPEEVRIG